MTIKSGTQKEIEDRLEVLHANLIAEQNLKKPSESYIADLNLSIEQCENNLKNMNADGYIVVKT